MTIKKIELHAGHWDYKHSGADGLINEVTENRKVGRRVRDILKSNGVPVTYFEDNTSGSVTQNINTLVNHHNKDNDGLVVSIHFNASSGTVNSGIGTEVLYYNQKELAQKVSTAISKATSGGLKNRGAKLRKDLGVLSRTDEPAILIEVCFVNSVVDVDIYKRDFEKICQAIAIELEKVVDRNNIVPRETKQEVKKEPVFYQLIAGTFQNYSNAKNKSEELKSKGIDNYIIKK